VDECKSLTDGQIFKCEERMEPDTSKLSKNNKSSAGGLKTSASVNAFGASGSGGFAAAAATASAAAAAAGGKFVAGANHNGRSDNVYDSIREFDEPEGDEDEVSRQQRLQRRREHQQHQEVNGMLQPRVSQTFTNGGGSVSRHKAGELLRTSIRPMLNPLLVLLLLRVCMSNLECKSCSDVGASACSQ